MKFFSSIILSLIFTLVATISAGKDLQKIAVWDLEPLNTPPTHARNLTSILVSEVSKFNKYEVYSQENVRTLAGWTAERMKLGCSNTQCLIALGQMDIAKLISGSVGKIGTRYTVSLNLFDTQNARSEKAISEFCQSEDELIELIQIAARKLLGEPLEVSSSAVGPLPREFKDPITGMEFILVKGGCFEMGDTFGDGRPDEKPLHEVCVDDFYLGKYEVTQGQWEKVMGNNPSRFKGRDNPVENVSWNDAQQFIERMDNQSGRKYRLPTEAEWEYAARSGGKKEKWAGTSNALELEEYAWYNKNSGDKTHPAGQKRPNGLGLLDMAGNVLELCQDWYDANYYQNSPKDNSKGPGNGQLRVLRGGSWNSDPRNVRASNRGRIDPADRYITGGFRLGASAR